MEVVEVGVVKIPVVQLDPVAAVQVEETPPVQA
jgi:hypothetical protein